MFIVMLLHKSLFFRNLIKLVLVYIRVVLDHFLQTVTEYKEYKEFCLYLLQLLQTLFKINIAKETSVSNCLFTWGQLEYFSLNEKLLILLLHKQIYTDDRS